ncbi:NUDIX domain-containing protein [Rhizobium sp. CSW-27]|uniref:NUDIX domain-containing protein n=1 Tax=Rhizobium sp. CSW-27 TaxID=2839985 RepID=UPI001C02B6B4|nr:NUDIX domain-containing protein [Rhizobium sp. CSW-27]MBT9372362.1 NUDIX domain-containing protein [Rhizobium sp. CSW-27]
MSARPGIDFPGVGCGLVIERADGHILLYRRMKAPEAGYWNIVGGKVDHMEHSAAAARREAEEETGLSIGAIDFLCVSEHMIEADGQHWVSVLYRTRDFSGTPSLTEPDKLSDFGWFSPDALPEPLSRFTRDALAHIANT